MSEERAPRLVRSLLLVVLMGVPIACGDAVEPDAVRHELLVAAPNDGARGIALTFGETAEDISPAVGYRVYYRVHGGATTFIVIPEAGATFAKEATAVAELTLPSGHAVEPVISQVCDSDHVLKDTAGYLAHFVPLTASASGR